jgi:hypothetical protein
MQVANFELVVTMVAMGARMIRIVGIVVWM